MKKHDRRESLNGSVDRRDHEAIAVNSTFDRDTEECVVVDVLGAGTRGGGAERSAAGECECCHSNSRNDEKFFHNCLHF